MDYQTTFVRNIVRCAIEDTSKVPGISYVESAFKMLGLEQTLTSQDIAKIIEEEVSKQERIIDLQLPQYSDVASVMQALLDREGYTLQAKKLIWKNGKLKIVCQDLEEELKEEVREIELFTILDHPF